MFCSWVAERELEFIYLKGNNIDSNNSFGGVEGDTT